MKIKTFTLLTLIFLLPTKLFCIEHFSSEAFIKFATLSTRSIASDKINLQFIYDFDVGNFHCESGIQFAQESFSLTSDCFYNFLNLKKFTLSGEVFLNCQDYNDISVRFNFFSGLRLTFDFNYVFSFRTQSFFVFKSSKIYAMQNNGAICSCDFALAFRFDAHLPAPVDFFVSLSSYKMFYFPLFLAPIFSLGGEYRFDSGAILNLEFSVRMIDFFTLSSYVDGFSVRLGLGWKFK